MSFMKKSAAEKKKKSGVASPRLHRPAHPHTSIYQCIHKKKKKDILFRHDSQHEISTIKHVSDMYVDTWITTVKHVSDMDVHTSITFVKHINGILGLLHFYLHTVVDIHGVWQVSTQNFCLWRPVVKEHKKELTTRLLTWSLVKLTLNNCLKKALDALSNKVRHNYLDQQTRTGQDPRPASRFK